jgi:hypothetical protein
LGCSDWGDSTLHQRHGRPIRGFRPVDDHELGASTLDVAESLLSTLQGMLREGAELELNPRKTRIVELPVSLVAPWETELRGIVRESDTIPGRRPRSAARPPSPARQRHRPSRSPPRRARPPLRRGRAPPRQGALRQLGPGTRLDAAVQAELQAPFDADSQQAVEAMNAPICSVIANHLRSEGLFGLAPAFTGARHNVAAEL